MARLIFFLVVANFVLLVSCSEIFYTYLIRSSKINSSSSANDSLEISTIHDSNEKSNEEIDDDSTKGVDGDTNKDIDNYSNEEIDDDSNIDEDGDTNEDIDNDSNEEKDDDSSKDIGGDTNEDIDNDSNEEKDDDSSKDIGGDTNEERDDNSNKNIDDVSNDVSDKNNSSGTDEGTSESDELVCGDSEVVDECPVDCPSDYCPKSENVSQQSCPKPDYCPNPACKCRFNYRLADNETCIPTRDCPPFDCSRPNEEFDPCPPICPSDDCSQASPTGRCPIFGRIGIILECKPKCRCIKNYWRLDGKCVPYGECPGVCPTNEIYSNCINAIRRPLNCSQAGEKNVCFPKRRGPCTKGCVCRKKYLRGYNGTCVPQDQCDSTKPTCPPNEEIDECANAICRAQNCTQKGLPAACPAVSECKQDCVCKENYFRDENGSCIPQDQCPNELEPTCPPNEEIDECANAICRAQKCTQNGLPVACPSVSECIKDCVCKENYLRDENGSCIPQDQCPNKPSPVCDDNEVVANCSADCPSDYCPKSEDEVQSCPTPEVCPPPTCKCGFNSRRAANGSCIPTRECPAFNCSSRPNEEYNPCPPLCPTEDCSQAKLHGRCPFTIGIVLPCNPKCRCIEDYYRLDGICVPYGECPNVCPINEEYSECISGVCRALNCSQKGELVPCPDSRDEPCERGCVCKENYLRAENGTCVPEDQCTNTTEPVCDDNEVLTNCSADCPSDYCPKSEDEDQSCPTPEVCPPPTCKCGFNYRRAPNGTCIPTRECPAFNCSSRPNEEYNPCPPLCPTEDCSQAKLHGRCPFTIGIVLTCNPKCRCIEDYYRLDGICVPYGECPNVCPINEEYSECISGVCRALNCSQKGERVPCPDSRDGPCEKGCVCKENYLRAENGTCVPEDQCTNTTEPVCDDNEVLANCSADCPSDYCPKSEDEVQSCPTPEVCPPPTCKCGFNSRRAPNGTCIPTRECPSFDCSTRPNEEYDSCPPLCPSDDCSQASLNGTCPSQLGHIGITVTCNPTCRCINNYWRKGGVCVPYGECPGVCPPNEVFSECINPCKPSNCTQKAEDKSCKGKNDGACERGCVCQDKYLRAENGTCVPEDQCEKPKPVCGDNEVVDDCPSNCTSDYCPKSESHGQICPKPNPCPPPACKCRFNFKRAENGTCILTSKCPPFNCTSRPNEEYNPCPPLCPTEDCSQAKLHGRCPFRIGIVLHCNPKCRCIKNHNRRDGICVPYGECPGICPTNEEYSECINKIDRPLNCSQVDDPRRSSNENKTDEPCQKGCVCQKNYLRNDNGTCVLKEQCKNTTEKTCTGPYEKYTDCKKTCPSDLCVSIVSRKICPDIEPTCEPGCSCISGYFRINATEPCGPVCDCPEMSGSIDCQNQSTPKSDT